MSQKKLALEARIRNSIERNFGVPHKDFDATSLAAGGEPKKRVITDSVFRWLMQFLMMFLAIPYTLIASGISLGLGNWAARGSLQDGDRHPIVAVFFLFMMIGYYLISFSLHYKIDRKKAFNHPIVRSIRLYVFCLGMAVLFIFIYYEANVLVYLFLVMIVQSVIFTWFISELVVRWQRFFRVSS